MNRISKLLSEKKEGLLSVYFTAGFPQLNSTRKILRELEAAGADMVEIGIPFSDPLADGPVIQRSSETALKNGMTLRLLFEQLKDMRGEVQLPVLLMGYLNPVLQFGIEKFLRECTEAGVDGVIIPDLPLREFESQYSKLFSDHDLKNIFLVTPQTSEARIRQIDALSNAFIYVVSSSSTTGMKKGFSGEQLDYFRRIKDMKLKNPSLIGFGISDRTAFETACLFSGGAITGSAFVDRISATNDLRSAVHAFVNEIKNDATILSNQP